jgi:hypothetical protein
MCRFNHLVLYVLVGAFCIPISASVRGSTVHQTLKSAIVCDRENDCANTVRTVITYNTRGGAKIEHQSQCPSNEAWINIGNAIPSQSNSIAGIFDCGW